MAHENIKKFEDWLIKRWPEATKVWRATFSNGTLHRYHSHREDFIVVEHLSEDKFDFFIQESDNPVPIGEIQNKVDNLLIWGRE